MDFSVSYRLTAEEVARATVAGMARQLRPIRLLTPAALVIAGFLVLLLEVYFLGIGLLVGAAVYPVLMPWLIRRAVRRQAGHMAGPFTLQLTDEGYTCRGEGFSQSLAWAMFDHVDTTQEFWVFSAKGRFIAFLPLAAFDGARRAELESMFRRRFRG